MYRVALICFCIFQRCTSHRTMYMTYYTTYTWIRHDSVKAEYDFNESCTIKEKQGGKDNNKGVGNLLFFCTHIPSPIFQCCLGIFSSKMVPVAMGELRVSNLLYIYTSSAPHGLLFKTKEGARMFSQKLVPIYQATHCHIPRIHNFSFLSVVVAIPCALHNLAPSSKKFKKHTANLMSWSSVWLRQSILSCGKHLKFFLQRFVTVCIHVVSHSRLFRI